MRDILKRIKIVLVDILITIIFVFPIAEIFPSTLLIITNSNFIKVFLIVLLLVLIHASILFYLLNWEFKQGKNSLSKKIVNKAQNSNLSFLLFLHHNQKKYLKYGALMGIAIVLLRYGVFLLATKSPTKTEFSVLVLGIFLKVYIYTLMGQGILATLFFLFKKQLI